MQSINSPPDVGAIHMLFMGSSLALGLLGCFYVTLVGLWTSSTLEAWRFNIQHAGRIRQIVSFGGQAFTVTVLTGLVYLVQAIAFNRAIHRRKFLRSLV